MTARRLVAAALLVAGCATRAPRVPYGLVSEGIEPFLASHPLAAGQELRVDEVGRTPSASYHLAQVRGSEHPHRHLRHDLTVVVLEGGGTLTLGDQRLRLAAGDVAVVPRGVVHWFANTGRGRALALIAITPPADEPDAVPEER
jgi:mannose-6-phosphate isomerase-like protein (cupin superfamily)